MVFSALYMKVIFALVYKAHVAFFLEYIEDTTSFYFMQNIAVKNLMTI